MKNRHAFTASCLIFGLMLSSGCGPSDRVSVSGRLLKGGAPYRAPHGHQVAVTFVGMSLEDPSGKMDSRPEPFVADYEDETSNFLVPGRDGRGIPRGRYRVAVTQRMTREAFEAARPKASKGQRPITRETDFLDDQFGLEKSPIVREIKESGEVVIDLDSPTGP